MVPKIRQARVVQGIYQINHGRLRKEIKWLGLKLGERKK